jgi:endonuclease G
MVQLTGTRSFTEVETPGHEPPTPAEELADRRGYDPDFLDGRSAALPLGTGDTEADMLPVPGTDGVDLKYMHFSVVMSKSRRVPMLTAVNIDASKARKKPRIDVWI